MMGIFQRKGGWVAAIIFAVIGFVLVNALASRVTGVRLDLTQDRLYTLSEGSENILGICRCLSLLILLLSRVGQ